MIRFFISTLLITLVSAQSTTAPVSTIIAPPVSTTTAPVATTTASVVATTTAPVATTTAPVASTASPTSPQLCAKKVDTTEDIELNLWESPGNTQLLSALNAAMKNILKSGSKWQQTSTRLGAEPLLPPTVGNWPRAMDAVGTFKFVLDNQKIRFGSTFTLPPFSHNDSSCLTGEEVYLGELICEEFSNQYNKNITAYWDEVRKTGDFWYDIAFALSGSDDVKVDEPEIDVILSSVTKTDKRTQGGKVVWTAPYIKQKYGVILSEMGIPLISNFDDLNNEAYSMSCSNGTSTLEFSKSQYPKTKIKLTGSFVERMMKVKNNEVHFAVGDAITVKNYQEKHCPKCKYLGPVGESTVLAMAVRPRIQPGANASEICEITSAKKSSYGKTCYRDSRSNCESCSSFQRSCSDAVRDKRKGYCCESSYCCAQTERTKKSSSRFGSKYKTRCIRSVRREGYIRCRESYSVAFSAKVQRTGFTDSSIFIDCQNDENCATKLERNYKRGTLINCTKNSDGTLNLELPPSLSTSTSQFVSLTGFCIVFMVWALIH